LKEEYQGLLPEQDETYPFLWHHKPSELRDALEMLGREFGYNGPDDVKILRENDLSLICRECNVLRQTAGGTVTIQEVATYAKDYYQRLLDEIEEMNLEDNEFNRRMVDESNVYWVEAGEFSRWCVDITLYDESGNPYSETFNVPWLKDNHE
jgi:hypothetical protein